MLPTIATGNVGSALAGEYEVANSLRFNDGSSDYLSKTFGTPTSTKKGTHSVWFKLSTLKFQNLIGLQDGSTGMDIGIDSSHRLNIFSSNTAPSTVLSLDSTQVLRDTSAWYHVVVAIDTTQATASNRVKVYLNGTQITDFATETYPSLNDEPVMCLGTDNASTFIGASPFGGGANFFDGYMAEYVYVDGSQLDADQFGEFDSDTNIWKPIDVSGLTFGTNGFYLDFENSGSLGADVSGNGNNFTVNNLTSIDQSTDTCTNNFATLNPLTNEDTDITLSQGNLDYTNSGSGDETVFASIGVSSGKWYFETKWTDTSNYMDIGVGSADEGDIGSPRADAEGTGYYMIQLRTSSPGTRAFNNGSAGSGLGNSALNDINMFAIDMDNNKFYAGKNGTWYSSGDPASGSNPLITMDDGFTTLIPIVCGKSSSAVSVNFGSPSYSISSGNSDGNGYGNFEYSVPSGYYALNTKNLAEYG